MENHFKIKDKVFKTRKQLYRNIVSGKIDDGTIVSHYTHNKGKVYKQSFIVFRDKIVKISKKRNVSISRNSAFKVPSIHIKDFEKMYNAKFLKTKNNNLLENEELRN